MRLNFIELKIRLRLTFVFTCSFQVSLVAFAECFLALVRINFYAKVKEKVACLWGIGSLVDITGIATLYFQNDGYRPCFFCNSFDNSWFILTACKAHFQTWSSLDETFEHKKTKSQSHANARQLRLGFYAF